MHNQVKRIKQNQGFTIIEVLIVLAIAGLILLIVFLAVPGLQRSARNESRKTDASALLAGVGTFLANNNNTMPGAITAGANGNVIVGCLAPNNCSSNNVQMGYYKGIGTNAGDVVTTPAAAGTNYVGGTAATDYLELVKGSYCGTVNGATADTTAGSANQYVVVFEVESGAGSYTAQCIND